MTVKSFTAGSVVIERRDPNGLFAVYKGKISRDGHSIVGGTVTFLSNHPVNSLAFTATWAAPPEVSSADRQRQPEIAQVRPGSGGAQPPKAASGDTEAKVKKADQLYSQRNYTDALALYRQAASAGQPHALMRIGFCYDLGYGVKQDPGEAARWYRKAVNAGDPEAMAYLGGLYADGAGVPVDYAQALLWFHKSADLGNPAGMNKLGLMYLDGRGVPRNLEEATRWFRRGADLGDMYAMQNLANIFTGKYGTPPNYTEALRLYRESAALGNGNSMVMLGHLFETGGFGLQQNPGMALAWYRKAAALGNELALESIFRFGRPTFDLTGDWEGYFTSPSMPDTIRITQTGNKLTAIRLRSLDLTPTGLAFFRGDYDGNKTQVSIELAQYPGLLGLMNGLGLSVFIPATTWANATLAIEDPDHIHIGKTPAFQRISMPSLNDLHCDADNSMRVKAQYAFIRGQMAMNEAQYGAAACWFHAGVVQGEPRSMTALGNMVRKGLGTHKNSTWAVGWFEKAAQNGDPAGAINIADMYDLGEIPPPDPAKSKYWHEKAKEMKDLQQKLVAQERKQAADQQAQLQLVAGLVNVGAQLIAGDLMSLNPQCDVRCQDRASNCRFGGTDPERVERREALIAAGQLNCSPPIDLSPLLPSK
ncbi:MAG: hypothetical protein ABSH52_11745 [Terriglobia bacterium]|jgi:TPR repeat protein